MAEDRREAARAALSAFLESTTWPVVRRRADRERQIDLRPHVLSADLADVGVLRFRLAVPTDGSRGRKTCSMPWRWATCWNKALSSPASNVELDA